MCSLYLAYPSIHPSVRASPRPHFQHRADPGTHIDESSYGRHNRSNNKKSLIHLSRHRKLNEQRVQLPSPSSRGQPRLAVGYQG